MSQQPNKTVEIPYEEMRAALEAGNGAMQALVDKYAGFSADIVGTHNRPNSLICLVDVTPKQHGN